MNLCVTEYRYYIDYGKESSNKELLSQEYRLTKGFILLPGHSKDIEYRKFIEIVDIQEDKVLIKVHQSKDITLTYDNEEWFIFHFPISARITYRYKFTLVKERDDE